MVGERFVWLHIPKTAGDATLLMFRQLDHDWRLIDPHTDPRKHQTLAEARARVPDLDRLDVIANLRRLPEVALSYFHHMQRHGANERHASGRSFGELTFREYVEYVIGHPESQSYDWILDNHLGDRDADHWLRVSDLAGSFADVIGRYVEISDEARARIGTVTANLGTYEKGLARWYEPGEIERLYANCPRWADAERKVYGGLLATERS